MPDHSPLNVIPESRDERWRVLSHLVADWYPQSDSDAGVSEDAIATCAARLGVSIPVALREWYARFGLRSDVWSQQDELLTPNRLRVTSSHLTFLVENQAVVEWGIAIEDLSRDDPPVYVTSVDDPNAWLLDSSTTSMFALKRFAYSLKFSRSVRWFANAFVPSVAATIVAGNYPELLATRSAWLVPQKFFGNRDTMVELEDVAGARWMYVVTRTAVAAARFKDKLHEAAIEWNATSDEWPDGWVNSPQDMR